MPTCAHTCTGQAPCRQPATSRDCWDGPRTAGAPQSCIRRGGRGSGRGRGAAQDCAGGRHRHRRRGDRRLHLRRGHSPAWWLPDQPPGPRSRPPPTRVGRPPGPEHESACRSAPTLGPWGSPGHDMDVKARPAPGVQEGQQPPLEAREAVHVALHEAQLVLEEQGRAHLRAKAPSGRRPTAGLSPAARTPDSLPPQCREWPGRRGRGGECECLRASCSPTPSSWPAPLPGLVPGDAVVTPPSIVKDGRSRGRRVLEEA